MVAHRGRVGVALAQELGDRAHDGRGVEAARDARANPDIGHHPAGNRAVDEVAEDRRVGAPLGREERGPEAMLGDAIVACHQVRPGRDGRDVRHEGRPVMVVVPPPQVLVDALVVGPRLERRAGQEALDLRREDEAPIEPDVIERLDPEVVPGEDQLRPGAALVEEGRGEHAVEAREARRPVQLVRLENDFGVGVGVERAASRLELRAQLAVVVDLAVVGQVQAPAGGRHRLVAMGQIEDRQAAVGDRSPRRDVCAVVVRPAVAQGGGEGGQQLRVGPAHEACDAAHPGLLPVRGHVDPSIAASAVTGGVLRCAHRPTISPGREVPQDAWSPSRATSSAPGSRPGSCRRAVGSARTADRRARR